MIIEHIQHNLCYCQQVHLLPAGTTFGKNSGLQAVSAFNRCLWLYLLFYIYYCLLFVFCQSLVEKHKSDVEI